MPSPRKPCPVVFCVIPARGGSKGLPGKNILRLGRLPLIGWTIHAARRSRTLTRTVVSTDDAGIAAAARACGGDVPFRRPAALARDTSGLVGVLQHAVRWFEHAEGLRADVVALLQPTSPFRTAEEIDGTVRLVTLGEADSAETVALDTCHPYHRYRLERGRLTPWNSAMLRSSRRQDFPPVYRPTGGAYAVRRDILMEKEELSGRDHRGWVCGELSAIDIDSEWDLRLARCLLDCAKPS